MSDTNSRLVYSTASGFVPEPTAKAASASPFPMTASSDYAAKTKAAKVQGSSPFMVFPASDKRS